MILMLMFSQKGTVELDVEEGTMRFAGRKVGTLKSSKSKDGNGAVWDGFLLSRSRSRSRLICSTPVPGSNPCRGALFLPIPVNKKISQPRSRPAPSNC